MITWPPLTCTFFFVINLICLSGCWKLHFYLSGYFNTLLSTTTTTLRHCTWVIGFKKHHNANCRGIPLPVHTSAIKQMFKLLTNWPHLLRRSQARLFNQRWSTGESFYIDRKQHIIPTIKWTLFRFISMILRLSFTWARDTPCFAPQTFRVSWISQSGSNIKLKW